MPEFGFPAQHRQAAMRSLISSLRGRSDDTRVAAVTGRYADVTRELGGRVNELMQIEKSISDLQSYAESIALSEARASTMQQALSNATVLSQGLTDTADLLLTNGTDQNMENLSTSARFELASIVSAINIDFGGRSLLAGDDAGTPAIADDVTIFSTSVPFLEGQPTASAAYAALEAEFMNPGATYDTAFYLGGAGNAPVTEVAPGERVDYNVRADEDPIRRLLLNATVLAAAFDPANTIPDNQRRELVRQASAGLRSGISQMTSIQSRLGAAEARIATMKSRNIASEASLTISFNELAGADNYDAALTLTELENQLEVAFATTARLANLTLANFR